MFSLNDRNDRDTEDWFANQYEQVVGKPLASKQLTNDEVLKRLKDSARCRLISEAKSYKTPVPPTGKVHYLKWSHPKIMKCTCPDQDCTCRGPLILPRKKIPRGRKYYNSPLHRKIIQYFRKPVPPPKQSFMQRLADIVGVETSIYEDLERNGILSIRGAEFCTSRCVRYYGAGYFPNSKDLMDLQKLKDKQIKRPYSDTHEGCTICNEYPNTVSTQTIIGSDGELIIGSFSHILCGSIGETVMKDIEGTELYISSYKSIKDDSVYPTKNQCNLDNLQSWKELINMKEIKNHLSLFKRNIYSSLFEIKETPAHDRNLTTQYEDECVIKKSSENISIASPYKGVVIKLKKDIQKTSKNQLQEGVPEIQGINSCNLNLNIVNEQSNSQGLKVPLTEEPSLSIRITEDLHLLKGSIVKASDNKISCLNQNEINDSLDPNCMKNVNSTLEQLETQAQIQYNLIDHRPDFNIIEIRSTENINEYKNKFDVIEIVNPLSKQIKLKGIFENMITQEISNISLHVGEHKENMEVTQQVQDISRLFNKHKNLVDIPILPRDYKSAIKENEIQTKRNMSNFIKKRLYNLSFEQLQKIKIKLVKSLSYTSDNRIFVNNKEKKSDTNNNKLLSKSIIEKNNDDFLCNNTTKSNDYSVYESKYKPVLPNFETSISGSKRGLFSLESKSELDLSPILRESSGVSLMQKKSEPQDLAQMSNTENKDSGLTQPIAPNSNVYNSTTSSVENYAHKQDISKIIQLKIEKRKNSDCKTNELGKTTIVTHASYGHHHDTTNKNLSELSLQMTSEDSKEISKQCSPIIKSVTYTFIQLKKLIGKKIDNSIKLLIGKNSPK